MILELKTLTSPGAGVVRGDGQAFALTIPAGQPGKYRLAQLDDYRGVPRGKFPWQAPVQITLQARSSRSSHAGTWGFGLWNDPFSASLGLGGMARGMPVLPNCAWFFYASPPNHLEIHDRFPADGFLAATFCSPRIPSALLLPFYPGAAFLTIPFLARWIRKGLRPFVLQDAARISADTSQWHHYQMDWHAERVDFRIDGEQIFSTAISPRGKLGLVIWIDNQYAAFPPDGRLRMGALRHESAQALEIKDFSIQKSSR